MLRKLGRQAQARALEQGILAGLPGARSVPKVSLTARLPPAVASPASPADSPYAARFKDQLRLYALVAEQRFADARVPRLGLREILERAERSRQYDASHSSTIEGCRVTPEEIAALVGGARPHGSRSGSTTAKRISARSRPPRSTVTSCPSRISRPAIWRRRHGRDIAPKPIADGPQRRGATAAGRSCGRRKPARARAGESRV